MLVSCPRGRTFDTFFTKANIELAESLGTVIWNPYARNMTTSEAEELIDGCDVYITTWGAPRLDRRLLDAAPELRLLTHLCDNPYPFASLAVWRRGVKVISGSEYYCASTAEGLVTYLLSVLRNIPEYTYRLKYKKEWKHSWDTNQSIIGKTVGIVNYNPVAAHAVRMLSTFGADFIAYDANRIPQKFCKQYGIVQCSLEDVFSESDIICIFSPVGYDRYHMIELDLLSRIRPGALLVNTSHGGIINPSSLAVALSHGSFHAVLDVYEKEPLMWNDPLFLFPNVTLMPHMAGPTVDLRAVVTKELLLESAEFIDTSKRTKHMIGQSVLKQ